MKPKPSILKEESKESGETCEFANGNKTDRPD